MDKGTDPEGGAGTDAGVVGLEGAVLQRMALDLAVQVECGVVPDDGQRPLGEVAAVVEDPAADPNPQQPPDQGLEGGTVEDIQVRVRHLPEALVPPVVRVVDGAELRS